MNIWQVARQIQYLLKNQNWTGSSTKVFNSDSVVIVPSESDIDALDRRLILPLCLLAPGAGQSDPQYGERGDLIQQELSVILATENPNDPLGQAAMVGAVRESTTDSRGRGVLELEQELFNAIKTVGQVNGIIIAAKGQGAGAARKDPEDTAYGIREYTWEVYCTTTNYYFPARRLAARPRTGEIDLTWQVAPDRYDRYRARLVRKAGSTAPTSPTDGTELTLSSALATSFNDTGLAPGTYSYSVFMSYDDFSATPALDLRTSDPVSVTGVTAF
jgi:hypothetical protein